MCGLEPFANEDPKKIPKPIHALELLGLHNVLGSILTYAVYKKEVDEEEQIEKERKISGGKRKRPLSIRLIDGVVQRGQIKTVNCIVYKGMVVY